MEITSDNKVTSVYPEGSLRRCCGRTWKLHYNVGENFLPNDSLTGGRSARVCHIHFNNRCGNWGKEKQSNLATFTQWVAERGFSFQTVNSWALCFVASSLKNQPGPSCCFTKTCQRSHPGASSLDAFVAFSELHDSVTYTVLLWTCGVWRTWWFRQRSVSFFCFFPSPSPLFSKMIAKQE